MTWKEFLIFVFKNNVKKKVNIKMQVSPTKSSFLTPILNFLF